MELPPAKAYGAKAALMALAGAATLFIGLIPARDSRDNRIDLIARAVGAFSVGTAGWFWLLSATEGRPGPYLLIMVPTAAVYAAAVALNLVFGYAVAHDKMHMQEKGYTKLSWSLLALTLGIILAVSLR